VKSTRTPLAAATMLVAATTMAMADVKNEIVTAIEHVQYSADAADIATAHMHLHHTLNCLVGPGGAGYDAKEIDPCKNAGHGIIPDTADAKARAALEAAAQKARDALAADDLAVSRADAAAIVKTLKALQ